MISLHGGRQGSHPESQSNQCSESGGSRESRQRKVQVWIYRRTNTQHSSPKPGIEAGQKRFEILLLLLTPERGGFWQPVTGGVDSDESYEEGAIREATEETGLRFEAPPVDLGYKFSFQARGRECEEHVFALRARGDGVAVRMDPREHTDARWVSEGIALRETLKSLKHESNAEGLRRLLRLLEEEGA